MRFAACGLLMALATVSTPVFAANVRWFTNPNKLHVDDRMHAQNARFSEADFQHIIATVVAAYQPLVTAHGATLSAVLDWQDPTVNAYADRPTPNDWVVHMFGGLARRPEATADGFALVVCHEIGHHLGGYPFYDNDAWAADEGQSDYFSTLACARRLWGEQRAENAALREQTPLQIRLTCNTTSIDRDSENLCYRTLRAGQSLGNLLAVTGGEAVPSLATPDSNAVRDTAHEHPAAQCRFDTYVAGALCNAAFPAGIIPGRSHAQGQDSVGAELAAGAYACTRAGGQAVGQRPACWFAPKMRLAAAPGSLVVSESQGNGNHVIEPGESVTVAAAVKSSNPDAVGGATATLKSLPDGVTASVSVLTYGLLNPGAVVQPEAPLALSLSPQLPCGSVVTLPLVLRSEAGIDQEQLQFRLGKLVAEPTLKTVGEALPIEKVGMISTLLSPPAAAPATTAVVEIEVDHQAPDELVAALIDPTGKYYVLTPGGHGWRDLGRFEVDLRAVPAEGKWTLFLVDPNPARTGLLTRWSLTLQHAECAAVGPSRGA